MFISRQQKLVFFVYFVIFLCYSIVSFALTDPNLVYLKSPVFWNFQQYMWQIPKTTVTTYYFLLVIAMFSCYYFLYRAARESKFHFHQVLICFVCVISPLLVSNNALSHDVFNYIFNARMVVKYQVNPHARVAIDFMYDPWTRFMHNVHTTAPYFYGWTLISLLPYVMGFEKFLFTWILFRLFSVIGLIACFFFVWQIMKKRGESHFSDLVLLIFNPLLIIELVSNSHNDGWLIWPALGSLWLVMPNERTSWWKIGISIALLAFSVSTKYATILLLPIWVFLLFQQLSKSNIIKFKDVIFKSIEHSIFDIAALLLFLPLFSARAQQFNPWYLSWSLMFYPLIKNNILKKTVLFFSITGLLRYLPWMYNGAFEYSPEILWQQKLILWAPVVVGILAYVSYSKILRPLTNKG